MTHDATITEAMMEAGAEVLRAWDEPRFAVETDLSKIENDLRKVARDVYLAMVATKRQSA